MGGSLSAAPDRGEGTAPGLPARGSRSAGPLAARSPRRSGTPGHGVGLRIRSCPDPRRSLSPRGTEDHPVGELLPSRQPRPDSGHPAPRDRPRDLRTRLRPRRPLARRRDASWLLRQALSPGGSHRPALGRALRLRQAVVPTPTCPQPPPCLLREVPLSDPLVPQLGRIPNLTRDALRTEPRGFAFFGEGWFRRGPRAATAAVPPGSAAARTPTSSPPPLDPSTICRETAISRGAAPPSARLLATDLPAGGGFASSEMAPTPLSKSFRRRSLPAPPADGCYKSGRPC